MDIYVCDCYLGIAVIYFYEKLRVKKAITLDEKKRRKKKEKKTNSAFIRQFVFPFYRTSRRFLFISNGFFIAFLVINV
jgi:hypothetical protein